MKVQVYQHYEWHEGWDLELFINGEPFSDSLVDFLKELGIKVEEITWEQANKLNEEWYEEDEAEFKEAMETL